MNNILIAQHCPLSHSLCSAEVSHAEDVAAAAVEAVSEDVELALGEGCSELNPELMGHVKQLEVDRQRLQVKHLSLVSVANEEVPLHMCVFVCALYCDVPIWDCT